MRAKEESLAQGVQTLVLLTDKSSDDDSTNMNKLRKEFRMKIEMNDRAAELFSHEYRDQIESSLDKCIKDGFPDAAKKRVKKMKMEKRDVAVSREANIPLR